MTSRPTMATSWPMRSGQLADQAIQLLFRRVRSTSPGRVTVVRPVLHVGAHAHSPGTEDHVCVHERTLGFRDRVLITVQEVIADHGLRSRVEVDASGVSIPEEKVGHLLATLREALSNTGRHARATRVEVVVTVDPDLVLTVRDDGLGLDGKASMGHGLANMRERARGLGGDMSLANSAQGGLELEWRIPL